MTLIEVVDYLSEAYEANSQHKTFLDDVKSLGGLVLVLVVLFWFFN